MVKPRIFFGILLSIILALSLSGCWDLVGIRERTLVIGMGIDKIPGPDPILLTVQVVNLQALKNGGGGLSGGSSNTGAEQNSNAANAVIVETSKGKSVYDAIHNFFKYSSRRVTFTHNRLIIMGKEIAASGMAGIMDDLARDYQFRTTNWLLVAENTAQEILKSRTDLGTIPAKAMDQMMINLTTNSMIVPVTFNDLVFLLKSEGHAGYVPLVQIEPPGTNPSPRIMIEKTTVFKNNRLIDILTVDEAQGLLWFSNNPKGGTLVFPYPSGAPGRNITVEISEGTAQIRPHITKDGIRMQIICTGVGTVRQMEGIANNPEAIEQLERRVESILANRVANTIHKAQRINADILGCARVIHGDYPAVWRRIERHWEQEFPRIPFSVGFQITITRFGVIKDPILATKRQE